MTINLNSIFARISIVFDKYALYDLSNVRSNQSIEFCSSNMPKMIVTMIVHGSRPGELDKSFKKITYDLEKKTIRDNFDLTNSSSFNCLSFRFFFAFTNKRNKKLSITNELFRICVLSHRLSANTIAKQLTKKKKKLNTNT